MFVTSRAADFRSRWGRMPGITALVYTFNFLLLNAVLAPSRDAVFQAREASEEWPLTRFLEVEDLLPSAVLQLYQTSSPLKGLPLPRHEVTLVGRGADIPEVLLQERWGRFSWYGLLELYILTATSVLLYPNGTEIMPRPPSTTPPPPLPSPPAPKQPLPWLTGRQVTVLDWYYTQSGCIHLEAGQRLTMAAMAFYAADAEMATVTGERLSQLAFSPIQLSSGSRMLLEGVTMVLSCSALYHLFQTLCLDLEAWPYGPEVEIADGIMRITNLTSRAPDPEDGTPGAGGQVQWINVTFTCSSLGQPPPPLPCTARSLADGQGMHEAARKALVDESASTVILTLTADVTLPADGSWEALPLAPGQQLVLRGDPARTTTLDLRGVPSVWEVVSDGSDDAALRDRPVALLYDLLLVNSPYPARPNGPMSLLVASLPSFVIDRGVLWEGRAQLRLAHCTLVVPESELDFLAKAVGRSIDDVWPAGVPPGGFGISLSDQHQESRRKSASRGSTSGSNRLEGNSLGIQHLWFMSEVLLSNCTLVSTSSYERLQGAVPVLPQSRVWLPQLLAARDPDTVEQWGPGGLMVAPGLQQALTDLVSCDSRRPGYNPVHIIWGPDDRSVPPLGFIPNGAITTLSSSEGTLASAASCIVDGGSPVAATPPLKPAGNGVGRVTSDLQGAIGRFSLIRPITLRNLVLYNLAPGGVHPTDIERIGAFMPLPDPPHPRPTDTAWANSSLPLWFFDFSRSDTDFSVNTGRQLDEASPTPSPSTLTSADSMRLRTPLGNVASDSPSTQQGGQQQEQQPQQPHSQPQAQHLPLLNLENVTLVVPEREWRAMVAAVMQVHAPEALGAAQQLRAQQPRHEPVRDRPSAIRPKLPVPVSSAPLTSPEGPLLLANPGTVAGGISDGLLPSIDGVGQGQGLDGGRQDSIPSIYGNSLQGTDVRWYNDDVSPPSVRTPQHSPSVYGALYESTSPVYGQARGRGLHGRLGGAAAQHQGNNIRLLRWRDFWGKARKLRFSGTPTEAWEDNFGPASPTDANPPTYHAFPASSAPTASGPAGCCQSRPPPHPTPSAPPTTPSRQQHSSPVAPAAPIPPYPPPPQPYANSSQQQQQQLGLFDFAAMSRVLSYNYSMGELVLAVARHYGWSGTNVTITYKLPPNAPISDKLMPYGNLVLPYNELADLAIDVEVDFSRAWPPQPSAEKAEGKKLSAPPPEVTPVSGPQSPSNLPGSHVPANGSRPSSGGSRHSWLVVLAISLAAIGGSLGFVLAAVLVGIVHMRRHRRKHRAGSKGSGNHGPSHSLGEASSRGVMSSGEVTIQCCSPAGPSCWQLAGESSARMACGGSSLGPDDRRSSDTLFVAPHKPPTPQIAVSGNGNCDIVARESPQSGSEEITAVHDSSRAADGRLSLSGCALAFTPVVGAAMRQTPETSAGGVVADGIILKAAADQLNGSSCKVMNAKMFESQIDERIFLQELSVYAGFMRSARGMRRSMVGAGDATNGLVRPIGPKPADAAGQDIDAEQGDFSGAIRTLQAELRDPDLCMEKVIGCGAFGTVYRGVWRGLPVAVKTLVLSQELAGREGRARQQAALEAAISMSMAHPNVVATYTFRTVALVEAPEQQAADCNILRRGVADDGPAPVAHEGKPNVANEAATVCRSAAAPPAARCDAVKLYIVQEYVNCGTLRTMLDLGVIGIHGAHVLLTLRLALDVARGMKHIHSCRIVHGDLKPENVLLSSEDTFVQQQQQQSLHPTSSAPDASGPSSVEALPPPFLLRAKVADFGLSVSIPDDATHASQRFQGTPAYRAPEVSLTGHLSPRADVWSFGLMLIELYFGCSLMEVLATCAALTTGAPPDQQQLPAMQAFIKDILTAAISDRQYAQLVRMCLSMEPRQRPHFGEIADALQAMFASRQQAGVPAGETAGRPCTAAMDQ